MKEYQIRTETKYIRTLVKGLYEKFLKQDNNWFYSSYVENDVIPYVKLRTSLALPNMESWLSEHGYTFQVYEYNASDEKHRGSVVDKYWGDFVLLFHAQALLACKVKDTHKSVTLERGIHLFFNMLDFGFFDEAAMLSEFSVGRAYVAGEAGRKAGK